MADTAEISVTTAAWVLISGVSTQGFFTNNGGYPLIYVEAAALPSAGSDVGHPLLPGQDGVNYSILAGQEIYAKATGKDTTVAVTVV